MTPGPSNVLINLPAYKSNIEAMVEYCEGAKICAVLKGDGYGLGAQALAKAACEAGVFYLAVADNEEAVAIQEAGVTLPILRIRCAPAREVEESIKQNLHIEETVGSLEAAEELSYLATLYETTLNVHIELDVGIGRSGLLHTDNGVQQINQVMTLAGLKVIGFYAHSPVVSTRDIKHTHDKFTSFLSDLEQAGLYNRQVHFTHFSNTACALAKIGLKHTMVRLGQATHGFIALEEMMSVPSAQSSGIPSSSPGSHSDKCELIVPAPPKLTPIMSWQSVVNMVRFLPAGHAIGYGSRYRMPQAGYIATIPVGFGSGFCREFVKGGKVPSVLIRNKHFPVVGAISMNLITVNVSEGEECGVRVGDTVTVIGKQGDEEITCDDLGQCKEEIGAIVAHQIGLMNVANRVYV
jgi:alanine racemase